MKKLPLLLAIPLLTMTAACGNEDDPDRTRGEGKYMQVTSADVDFTWDHTTNYVNLPSKSRSFCVKMQEERSPGFLTLQQITYNNERHDVSTDGKQHPDTLVTGSWFSVRQYGTGDSLRVTVQANAYPFDRVLNCTCHSWDATTLIQIRQEGSALH